MDEDKDKGIKPRFVENPRQTPNYTKVALDALGQHGEEIKQATAQRLADAKDQMGQYIERGIQERSVSRDINGLFNDLFGASLAPDSLKGQLVSEAESKIAPLRKRAQDGDKDARNVLSQLDAMLKQKGKSSPVSLSWQD